MTEPIVYRLDAEDVLRSEDAEVEEDSLPDSLPDNELDQSLGELQQLAGS
jgi:hypothetical protein